MIKMIKMMKWDKRWKVTKYKMWLKGNELKKIVWKKCDKSWILKKYEMWKDLKSDTRCNVKKIKCKKDKIRQKLHVTNY